jgi:lipoprotein NlpD
MKPKHCKYMSMQLWITGMLMLSACTTRETLAPVVESHFSHIDLHAHYHEVAEGENLEAIAFRYEKDSRTLAKINHLAPPYRLFHGQKIVLYNYTENSFQKNVKKIIVNTTEKPNKQSILNKPLLHAPAITPNCRWLWPINGKITQYFAPKLGHKGVNIAAKPREQVHATASGVVAYAGFLSSGYNNLVIIKHDNNYLSAYGNNSKILVKTGQKVQVGQSIALAGKTDLGFGIHFEIRKQGMPQNPMIYLQHKHC